jgi:hypothetical protein
MYPHYPSPLQGEVVRVRALHQAYVLLPSTRREIETDVSISQTFYTSIGIRFVFIAFFVFIVGY